MKLIGERKLTKKQVDEIMARVDKKEISKGAGIREMFAGGMSVKEISAESGIRYNHVYNVVKNEILVKGLQDEVEKTSRENSKKNQIVELLKEGKSITEVSAELKCLYNYVWQIAKSEGLTQKQLQEAKNEAKKEAK